MRIAIPVFERVCMIINKNEKFVAKDHSRGTWINAISFKNTGQDDATINDAISMSAGSSQKVFGSELPAIDTTTYDIKFLTTVDPEIEVVITYCNGFRMIDVSDDMVIPANK